MELKTEITLSPAAIAHLCAISAGYAGLRLTILGGRGCGGNEYDLVPVGAEAVEASDDYMVLSPTQKLFIPALDILKFFGTKIDFIEDQLGNRRLEITNPNESGRCGCGQSVTF